MKFMETINKLQAALTELRREAQRSEAPKCKCKTFKDTILPNPDCPVHGKSTWRETAGKLPCRHSLWTCPICHAKEYAKYMVPGCICYPKIPGSHKDCPVHGTAGKYQGPKVERIPPEKMDYSDTPIHGMTDPHKCFVCGEAADMGWGNALGPQRGYCRKHMPETATGTAGECTCPPHSLISIEANCPIHGRGACIKYSTPDLPLHVRVAKALGLKVDCNGEEFTNDPAGCSVPLDEYDTDLVAAMGALEEYCEKKKNYSICYYPDLPKTLRISIWDLGSGGLSEINVNCPLPQAICEVIVAHAEGK